MRRWLLADLERRIASEREREPLIAHEIALLINVAELRVDATERMRETAARVLNG